jgi:hypothetical protein
MERVVVGKTTNNFVEFLIYDEQEKRCGSLIYSKKYGKPKWDIIGDIPTGIMKNLEKIKKRCCSSSVAKSL